MTLHEPILSFSYSRSNDDPMVFESCEQFVLDARSFFKKLNVTNADIALVKIPNELSSAEVIFVAIECEKLHDGVYKVHLLNDNKLECGGLYKIELKINDLYFQNFIAVNHQLRLTEKGFHCQSAEEMMITISDIHLGADNAYTECLINRPFLENFLDSVIQTKKLDKLVIAGDLIDEWYVPATDTLAGRSQMEFVVRVQKNNKDVFDKLNKISSNHKLVYVPGNHDLLFESDEIKAVLPDMIQYRDVDKDNREITGLGTYVPEKYPYIAVEHGHRCNVFCAPNYQFENGTPKPNSSILPAGYFFTRIAVEAFVNQTSNAKPIDYPIAPVYGSASKYAWSFFGCIMKSLLQSSFLSFGFYEKFIVTRLDNLTENMSLNDVLPQFDLDGNIIPNFYYSMIETWNYRQEKNNMEVKLGLQKALEMSYDYSGTDEFANIQYFLNPSSETRIVLFGHSHISHIISYKTAKGQKAIYANTGTWVDRNTDSTTMNFVVVFHGTKSNLKFVNLYQYLPSGDIKLLDSQAIILDSTQTLK